MYIFNMQVTHSINRHMIWDLHCISTNSNAQECAYIFLPHMFDMQVCEVQYVGYVQHKCSICRFQKKYATHCISDYFTLFWRGSGQIIQWRIDVKNSNLKLRILLHQRVRHCIELLIETLGISIEPRHAVVASQSKERNWCREAAHRRQSGHSNPPSPQTVQTLDQAWEIVDEDRRELIRAHELV